MDTQNDIFVYVLDLPESIRGRVVENEDSTYTIFINAKLSYEMQIHVYQHELKHIENGDFEKTDVQQIEAIAHADQAAKDPIIIKKKKRRRRNRYGQYEKQRRALAAFGVDAWSQYDAHWLDPDYRF